MGKTQGEKQLGRCWRGQGINISMDYKEVSWEVVNWINVIQNEIHCRVVVINETSFPIKFDKFLTQLKKSAFTEQFATLLCKQLQ